jgi:hypothetical protein
MPRRGRGGGALVPGPESPIPPALAIQALCARREPHPFAAVRPRGATRQGGCRADQGAPLLQRHRLELASLRRRRALQAPRRVGHGHVALRQVRGAAAQRAGCRRWRHGQSDFRHRPRFPGLPVQAIPIVLRCCAQRRQRVVRQRRTGLRGLAPRQETLLERQQRHLPGDRLTAAASARAIAAAAAAAAGGSVTLFWCVCVCVCVTCAEDILSVIAHASGIYTAFHSQFHP